MGRWKAYWLLVLASVLVWGCDGGETPQSELFKKLVKPEAGGTYRGVDLGMPLDSVRRIEGSTPRHDDKYGFVYEYNLGENRQHFLEYICKNPQNRVLSSIVSNVFLKDEGETTELYNELEVYLRGKYDVADGELGDLRWKDQASDLLVSLRILDDKKSLSLNFVPASGY